MKRHVLLDTGPLVASLNRRDHNHAWALAQWKQIEPPLLTCEAVLSEACFLLQRAVGRSREAMQLLLRGAVQIAFPLQEEAESVSDLMDHYADVPMSLADACLVRMAELHTGSTVFTLDSDFRRYRKHKRQVIPLIIPDDRQ